MADDIQLEYRSRQERSDGNSSRPSGWTRLKARAKIGQIAASMVGQHYLHGAKGARPNGNDGARVRPAAVRLLLDTDPANPAFIAAATELVSVPKSPDGGPPLPAVRDVHVCGGRYALCGRVVTDNDQNLRRYLAAQDPSNPGRCFTAAFMTPRRVRGTREPAHVLCWGESCDGWRHFDCIGLVEYCVDQVTGRVYGGEIWQWASPKNVLGAARMGNSDPILDGDLVSQVKDGDNFHHIGILYLDDDGIAHVSQAEETKKGVTTGRLYDPAGWNGGRWRLPDQMLLEDGAVTDDMPGTDFRPRLSVPPSEVSGG